MKIGQPADKPPVAATASSAPATAADAAARAKAEALAAEAAASAGTTVALSSTAATMLSPAGTPDFDADKVKRMSDAIANGTFVVDAGAIADRLIANAKELLDKVKG